MRLPWGKGPRADSSSRERGGFQAEPVDSVPVLAISTGPTSTYREIVQPGRFCEESPLQRHIAWTSFPRKGLSTYAQLIGRYLPHGVVCFPQIHAQLPQRGNPYQPGASPQEICWEKNRAESPLHCQRVGRHGSIVSHLYWTDGAGLQPFVYRFAPNLGRCPRLI